MLCGLSVATVAKHYIQEARLCSTREDATDSISSYCNALEILVYAVPTKTAGPDDYHDSNHVQAFVLSELVAFAAILRTPLWRKWAYLMNRVIAVLFRHSEAAGLLCLDLVVALVHYLDALEKEKKDYYMDESIKLWIRRKKSELDHVQTASFQSSKK